MNHTATQQFHAILFADVAGSTRLYETLGNRAAKQAIDALLERMTAVVRHYDGVLVKTIGDEMLCRFALAERAVSAAIAMQEAITADNSAPVRLQMRMGLQWGPVILDAGDVFGDAVNVGARMSAIARAGQIITTRETVAMLPEALALKTRLFDTTAVKGKQDELVIYEVVWQEEENATLFVATTMPGNALAETAVPILLLRYQDMERELVLGGALGIGRAETCDLVVNSPLASRLHARIESRRGKFVFIDQSTNGSYVRSEDGNIVYLRREELPLWGSGEISLGENFEGDPAHLLHFRV
ncbi:MAG TPA: adenylate/guanylate cyclase domain-containing protein [Moraxellaceae bacterium]|nr:adenylate/guanylate cyclase domain-containing protein [Moraxellaceae bacterium]